MVNNWLAHQQYSCRSTDFFPAMSGRNRPDPGIVITRENPLMNYKLINQK